MFGVLTFRGEYAEMGLSIGFRNSYDKSMAIGIAMTVCSARPASGQVLYGSMVGTLTDQTGAVLPGLVRVSLGIENSREDVDTFLRVLNRIARQPRSRADKLIASAHYGTRILPRTETQHHMDDFARTAARRVYARG